MMLFPLMNAVPPLTVVAVVVVLNGGLANVLLQHRRGHLSSIRGILGRRPAVPGGVSSSKSATVVPGQRRLPTYDWAKVLSPPTVLLLSRSLSTRGSTLFIMSDLCGPAVLGAGPVVWGSLPKPPPTLPMPPP